ncbi:MAG: PAS domain S-box protein [Nitrospirota bacterium]
MKRKIVIGLSIFTIVFLLGGIYIITTIERATSTLDNLIKLHQVEILREHLLIQVKMVQSDLNLKNTRYARSIDTVTMHVRNMEKVANACFRCHHSGEVETRLKDLSSRVEQYKVALSRALTMRASTARLAAEEHNAFTIGEDLIAKVNTMITMASSKLEEKTQSTLDEIASTKSMLFILLVAGPLLAAGLTFVFIRAFTKPVNVLYEATQRIKTGDLDHRVEGLKDEFGAVAASFNDMAVSLKEHMHRIEESEKRYRTLFESARDAIFILEAEGDQAGRIIAANKAAAEMHGYSVEELLSLHITDLDTPDAAMAVPGRIKRILDGEWIKAEITHRKKDGTVFPVEVSAGLLELKDHKYILAFDRDVTERKQAEERLQQTEQLKMCGEFAAGLAHEIKNPLAGIKVTMEVLSEELPIPEQDKDVLLKVVAEIRRIELLIRDLLNFAKPPKPQLMQVDIHKTLDAAITFSVKSPSFSTEGPKAISIVRNFAPRLPETMADPMQMQQVFLNLLLNATDAMPEGGMLSVQTSYNQEKSAIYIEIADTGKGIDEKAMENIFKPFFTTKPKGTGLGLAITKRLIEQQGGVISAENRPGGGAVFTIVLPVKKEEGVVPA